MWRSWPNAAMAVAAMTNAVNIDASTLASSSDIESSYGRVCSTARTKLLRRGPALRSIKERAVLIIRKAKPEEAVELTALATRSKAHWGYDAAFMERVRSALTQSPEKLASSLAFVVEDEDGVAGF